MTVEGGWASSLGNCKNDEVFCKAVPTLRHLVVELSTYQKRWMGCRQLWRDSWSFGRPVQDVSNIWEIHYSCMTDDLHQCSWWWHKCPRLHSTTDTVDIHVWWLSSIKQVLVSSKLLYRHQKMHCISVQACFQVLLAADRNFEYVSCNSTKRTANFNGDHASD